MPHRRRILVVKCPQRRPQIVTGCLRVAPLPLWCSVTGAVSGHTVSGPRRGIHLLSSVGTSGAAPLLGLTDYGLGCRWCPAQDDLLVLWA